MKQAGKCTPKIKNTCGSTNFSSCIIFEGTPNETSPLADESCLDQEIVTQDIYDQLGEIIEDISTEGLGDKCLTYPENNNVNQTLIVFEEEICDLKAEIEALKTTDLCNKSIEGCDLDLGCLVESCDCEITTFSELQQAIINKVCETESETVVQNNFVRQLLISEDDLPEDYTEQDVCDYILNLPDEERTIAETDSKWNVITDSKLYEIQNIGKGLINTLSPTNLLLLKEDVEPIVTTNLQKVISYPADFTGTNYTLTDVDDGHVIFIDNDTTDVTITLNLTVTTPNFEVGFIQEGSGDVSFLGGLLTNPIGLKIKGAGYQAFIERKLATSSFYLLGNTMS